MKKIFILLGLALAIVSGCMIYLVLSGVVLRSAPLIKPTVVTADLGNVGQQVVLRMYPELLKAHYVLLGFSPLTAESEKVLSDLQVEAEKLLVTKVSRLDLGQETSAAQIAACPKPCWLLLPKAAAHELRTNTFIEEKIKPLGKDYLSLNFLEFEIGQPVTADCDKEKRLDYECLGPVAVREVARKFKQPDQRYFFLRKYSDRDYFLMLQKAHSP